MLRICCPESTRSSSTGHGWRSSSGSVIVLCKRKIFVFRNKNKLEEEHGHEKNVTPNCHIYKDGILRTLGPLRATQAWNPIHFLLFGQRHLASSLENSSRIEDLLNIQNQEHLRRGIRGGASGRTLEHLGPLGITLGSHGITWDHLEPSLRDHLRSSIWDGSLKIIWNLGLSGITWHHLCSSAITLHRLGSSGLIWRL